MSDDIVNRLRLHATFVLPNHTDETLSEAVMQEAADEIERLREEVKHWHERAYLHAPHVVKQAWIAEAEND